MISNIRLLGSGGLIFSSINVFISPYRLRNFISRFFSFLSSFDFSTGGELNSLNLSVKENMIGISKTIVMYFGKKKLL